jgi:phage major head subunit gpT-like protein
MKATHKWIAGLALFALAIAGAMLGYLPFDLPSKADSSLALAGFGGIMINRSNLNAMFTGFNTAFNDAFAGAQSDWNQVAMEVPSTQAQEQYAWLGSMTRFREWIGDRVIQNLKSHDFAVKNKSFENTVGVDRDNIEDDTFGVYKPMFSQLGQDAKNHPDELVFALMAAGFSSPCYDAQYFFDTDHPVVQADGTTASVSNFGGGAGTAWYLLDASKMVKPFIFQKRRDYKLVKMDQDTDEAVFNQKQFRYGVDARCNVGYGLWQLAYASKQALDATNYGSARTALMSMKGDGGKPLGVRPSLLVVPPSLEKAALDILQAEKIAGTDNVYRNTAKLLVTPWLS